MAGKAWAVTAAVAGLIAGPVMAAEPPPLKVYADDPTIAGAWMAPDGHAVATLQQRSGRTVLMLLPAGAGAPELVDTGALDLRGVDWIDPDHLLLLHSSLIEGGDVLPRQRVIQGLSFNVRTRQAVTLLAHTASTVMLLAGGFPDIGVDPEGRPEVYTRALVRGPSFALYRVSALTGVGQAMTAPSFEAEAWQVAPDGTVLAAKSLDLSRRGYTLKVNGPSGWKQVDLGPEGETFDLVGLGRSPGTVAVKRGGDLLEVTTDGAVSAPLQPAGATVDDVLSAPTSRRLVMARVRGETPRDVFFDPKLEAGWVKVSRAFRGQTPELVSVSEDLTGLAIRVHGPASTGAYYWVDLKTMHAEPLGASRAGLTAEQIGEVKGMDVVAGDGLKLRAILTLPPGARPRGLPAVVLVHDGPDRLDDLTFDENAQALASRGYAVLKVNFRGSEGAAEALKTAGRNQWGRRMQTDLSDAVAAAAREGIIDPKRVCIAGSGYGGYAALTGVTVQSGIYRCALAMEAIADLPGAMTLPDNYTRGGKWRRTIAWRRMFDPPLLTRQRLLEVSPLAHAGEASAPVLLIHAGLAAEPDESDRMHLALDRAGKPNRLLALDPKLPDAVRRLATLTAELEFLARYNPP